MTRLVLLALTLATASCMPPAAGNPGWLQESRAGAFRTDDVLQDGCGQVDPRDIGREIGSQEVPALRGNLRRGARCDVIQGPITGRDVDQSRTDSAVIATGRFGTTGAR